MTIETARKLNTTNLPDEQFVQLTEAGFSIQEIERWYAQIEYRKEYNSRPEVREKRKQYTKNRYERMKQLSALLKEVK